MLPRESMNSLRTFLKRTWLYDVYDKHLRKSCDNFRRRRADRPAVSYSQCGEDLIMDFLCRSLQIVAPRYLDIGTNDPVRLNNTYLFYKRGCSGVLVEPDPALYAKIVRKRKRDICLNVGVGASGVARADFYEFTDPLLNTFSKEEALKYSSYGSKKIRRCLQIDLLSLTTLLERHFAQPPDIVSLDIEGLDFAVLQSLDFSRHRPKIFCVETLTYSENNSGQKMGEIIDLMKANRYQVYADTYINTIFVDAEILKVDRAPESTPPRSG